MQRRRVLVLFGLILAVTYGLASARALAATPSFTISATNATMTTSGAGSIPWTLTSVDGYSGTVQINCGDVNAPEGATLPLCGGSVAPVLYTLNANEVLNGSVSLLASTVPCSGPCPVKLPRRPSHGGAVSLALAVPLLLGLGFRRRAPRWLALMLLTIGTLAGLAAINACGGSGSTSTSTLTPGVWPYTIRVSDETTNETASTTINVTVPSGVPTNLSLPVRN